MTVVKDDKVSGPQHKRKNNLLIRASELLKDSLLNFKDKSKKIDGEESDSEVDFSAKENPKSFMKAHFPVVYPYTRKIKHVTKNERPFAANLAENFAIKPQQYHINLNNPTYRKVWSPVSENKIDCNKLILINY